MVLLLFLVTRKQERGEGKRRIAKGERREGGGRRKGEGEEKEEEE